MFCTVIQKDRAKEGVHLCISHLLASLLLKSEVFTAVTSTQLACFVFLRQKTTFFHWPHLLVAAEIQLTDNSLWLVSPPALLEMRWEINSSRNKASKTMPSESQHRCHCSDAITQMYFPPFLTQAGFKSLTIIL